MGAPGQHQVDVWVAAYEAGRGTVAIGTEHGVSPETVRRHLRLAGVTIRSHGGARAPGEPKRAPEPCAWCRRQPKRPNTMGSDGVCVQCAEDVPLRDGEWVNVGGIMRWQPWAGEDA